MSEPADLPLRRACRKAAWRLLPLLFVCYVIAYVDRTNVAIARLAMSRELPAFDDAVFGFGAGVFFWGYFLLEVPGSVLVERWSARKWICRIMVSWGLVAGLTALVRTPGQFYAMRFLLGLAEAGFFPGVIVYLTHWFPARERARALAWFFVASPIAQIVGPYLSTGFLRIGAPGTGAGAAAASATWLGLGGWQWVYVAWAIPAVVLGFVVLRWLADRPADAAWLTEAERTALETELARERAAGAATRPASVWKGLSNPRVLLLCVAFFANVTANYGIEFFLPTILTSWYAVPLDRLAWLVALPSVLVLAGQLFVGWSSDRRGERRWHVLVPISLAAVALVLTPATHGRLGWTVACFVVASAGLKAYMPAFWAMPNLFLSASAAAASIGLINSVGNLGGFFGPAVLGRVSKLTSSYDGGLYYLAGSIGVAIAIVATIRLEAERPAAAVAGQRKRS